MTMRPRSAGGLVYSTDSGRMCPDCGRPKAECICRQARAAAVGDGIVRVSREKKGRGGKTVTLARGLMLEPAALSALGRELKAACGSGGAVVDGVIEIQGDHVERVMQQLQGKGLLAKKTGG